MMVSFAVQKLLIFIRYHPVYYFLFLLILYEVNQKDLAVTYAKEYSTYAFLHNFIVSGLTFGSLIHSLRFFFFGVCVYDSTEYPNLIFLHVPVQFSQQYFIEEYSTPLAQFFCWLYDIENNI